ncbi:MAG: N-acetylmuramoyl-L-alanine amidase family protein, partial [Verrucomicrobiales bacterium]
LHWAMAVERHLHDMGVNTAITRDKDITLSLSDRAAYAKYFQRPLFVSLHYNGATNQQAKGIETFFYNQASRRLASLVQDALIRATGAKDRGVKNRGFKVICENVAPVAVLVEGGFLSNVSERTRISQIAYREMQAHAVATAIAAFMGRHPMALPPQPRRTVLVRQPIPQSPRTAVPVWVSAAPANTISSSFQRLTRFWR